MIQGDPASRSLAEVHSSVHVRQIGFWRRMLAFSGPAYLVSVGYMDPGNWATDLEGGARFGYHLLWVLVMSNLMAVLLQTLCARLGIVRGRDLAQACRESYPPVINYALWILCELAIAACDLAEVIGAAIALNLLFHLPLLYGVLITSFDTLLILWLTRYGIRIIESVVLVLIATIGGCFAIEIFLAKPDIGEMASGLIPRLNRDSLYVAIGILGATVMPHNLYLHSALVQTRRIGKSVEEKREACRFNLIDSTLALNLALLVNAGILILSASTFFKHGQEVKEIQQAYQLLTPLLGTGMASVLFAVALLCAGQSSTITGTMAGQIVMEGFVNIRMQAWLRRLVTRLIAIIPAIITIVIAGEESTYQLLIFSQVVLSLQLPFAIIPLIHFTSDQKRMGEFANARWVQLLAWVTAAIIVALNLQLAWETLEAFGAWVWLLVLPILGLLLYVTASPWIPKLAQTRVTGILPEPEILAFEAPKYELILVPLDHSDRDRFALGHASALARQHGARLLLLHIEEGVTSQVYGDLSETAEVEEGSHYLTRIVGKLKEQGIEAEASVVHRKSPRQAIIEAARAASPSLIIMAAHGHAGIKDLIFGSTINAVRHEVAAPVLIVR
ncbi:Nramp family divalent metal transporter [Bryobacter aggregatus]|uniref:Nramp family divalent metal transporter n=1 Tax=Bryobacter aggregatus TaxID=360054 RepID=UPI0004E20914|nr:Nramp family divalent metal transporter [Bryobacter aggregatus]